MNFLFKEKDEGEINKFEKVINVTRLISREATLRILNTTIIYNRDEEYYYTLATCKNENNQIETISIEGFEIHMNVVELIGAYIDYAEYEENSEVNYTGNIYYLLD